MSQAPETYHIVGGGIAGLSCAWFLKQKKRNVRVVVYEAGSRLGGRAYSYYDQTLETPLDNGVHAIVGANGFLARFVKKNEWNKECCFLSLADTKIDTFLLRNKNSLLKAICNTAPKEVSSKIKTNIFKALFPFWAAKRKVWFSKQNLSQRIVNLLAGYADEVHINAKLEKISGQFGVAAQLKFGKKEVDIGAKDKVIIALDNASCRKVLNVPELEHNQIINITYRVSQTIFLPRGSSFVGIKDGVADWLFVNDNLVSAVISDYTEDKKGLPDLAMKVWAEIDKIRGVNSAFVPPHKVVCHKNATLRQNDANNLLRPQNALTEYPNVFIAGDWTMKDYPCCMETAVKSARRAVETALKAV